MTAISESSSKLYFVPSNGAQISTYRLEGRAANQVSSSLVNGYVEISIDDPAAEGGLQIYYDGTDGRGRAVSEDNGILIVNTAPGLRWSWPKEVSEMNFEYDPDAPLESYIPGIYPGSMFMTFVFRDANGNITNLDRSDLKTTGNFFELKDFQKDVIEVVYTGVGTGGTITYTTGGTDYVIDIDAAFHTRDFYFYKNNTATAENCIPQDYTFDGTNDTFYYIPSNGCTIKSCHIVSGLDSKVTAAMETGYVKFTINDPNTNGNLEIEFDGTDADGNSFTNRRDGLNINNTQPALGWRWPGSWNQDTPISSNEAPRMDGMSPSKGYQWDVEILLDLKDGNAPQQIPFSKLSFSGIGDGGGKLMEASELPNGFVQIRFIDWGTGTISYEDASGKIYSIDVRSDLPSAGIYSSDTASKTSFLDNWRYDGTNGSVYYINTDPELDLDSDPVWKAGSPATITKISADCAKITLTQLDKDNPYIEFEASFVTLGGHTQGPWSEYLDISDMRPGLFWRPASRQFNSDGSFTIVANTYEPFDSTIRLGPGNNMDFEVLFSKKDGSVPVQVPYGELKANGNCFTLSNPQGNFAFIEAETWGSGTIEWTDSATGATYTLDVTVEIPELAFYTAPPASQSTYIEKQIWKYDGTNDTIYFIPYGPFTLVKAEWSDGAPADVTLDKANNCAKITLKNEFAGEGFVEIGFETLDLQGNSYGTHLNAIQIEDLHPILTFDMVSIEDDGTKTFTPAINQSTGMILDESDLVVIRANGTELKSGVSCSDPSVASLVFDAELDCWKLTALKEGKCELSYTDASGTKFMRLVEVFLGSGIYKEKTASASALLHAEDKTEYTKGEPCSVYYVDVDPWDVTNVEVKSGAVTVTKETDDVYRIDVADSASGDFTAIVAVTVSFNGNTPVFEYEINFTEKVSETPSTPSSGGGGGTPAEEPAAEPAEEPAAEEMVTVETVDPQTGETVEVEVTKDAAEAAERFDDVEPTDWYADAVGKAVENGFMTGTSDKTFAPETTLTRGMLAQMLYAMAGSPAVEGNADFTDIDENDWYAKAIVWASGEGVAAGYGETFGAEDPVTREQMVTMLLAYAKRMGYDIVDGADLSPYTDESAISSWAENAMAWAKGADLISGRSDVLLAPDGTATRAETAVILNNFLKFVVK